MIRFSRFTALLAAMAVAVLAAGARTSLHNDSIRMEPMPVYDSSHPSRLVRFTPVVAIGGASTINNYRSVIPGLTDMQTSPGPVLRAGLHVDFMIHRSLAITTGLEASVNNADVAIGMVNDELNSVSSVYLNHRYFEAIVPIMVSVRFNMGWRLKSVFGAGIYLAQGIGGTTKASGYTSGINSIGQAVVDHLYYSKDYYSDSMPVINSVKDFDFGPRLSAGFLYRNRWSWNFVFQTGIPNLAHHNNALDIHYRHINLAMELGYTF